MSNTTYAIDLRETIAVGGAVEHLRIRGTCEQNPVLLFLHGGPGVADRHWVLKNQSGLADVCTLVCWDQRGAGLSYDGEYAKAKKLDLAMMIEDARQVAEYLRKKFNKDRIAVVGHSWGSVLGTLLVQKHPELFSAYIGMGQFVNGPDNERLSYEFVVQEAARRGNRKALRDLERIGAPACGRYKSMQNMTVQRNYMTKFGGGEYKGGRSIWTSMIIPLALSPEYGPAALPRYAKGAFYSLRELWDEVVALDFNSLIPKLEVPVTLTEGRHDKNTPVELAQKWFDALEAPSKRWIWFEQSAHSPIKEEPEAWGKAVREILEDVKER